MPKRLEDPPIAANNTGAFVCPSCGVSFPSNRKLAGHRVGKHIRSPRLKNVTINLSELTQSQKGYLAGFLDGEGGIQITRSQRRDREYTLALHPMVYFTNTKEHAIRTLRKWLGAGSISHRVEGGNHNDTFALNITGTRNISALLHILRPYLIIKSTRADVLIEFCESRMQHYRGRDRRFNDGELRLYTTLRELNERGGATRRQRTEV